jgi:hypothetical protein
MFATLLWPFSFVTVMWFQPDIPKNQPAPAPPDTSAADKAAADAKIEARRKRGNAANRLTSPAGAKLGDSGQGGQKTLGTM